MAIRKRDLAIIVVHLLIIATSILFLLDHGQIDSRLTFISISRFGTVVALILWAMNIWMSGSFFSNLSFIYMSFVLFQYGIPILYATSDNYSNFYMSFFNDLTIIPGSVFTIFCIEAFSVGILLHQVLVGNSTKRMLFANTKWAQNDELVLKAAKWMFFISAIIYVPATFYGAVILRSRFLLPAIGGLAKQFYFPAAFLILCYTKSNRTRYFIYFMILLESILAMFTGGRTEGLLPLMVFVVYWFEYRPYDIGKKKAGGIRNSLLILVSLVVVLVLLVYIAQVRVGTSTSLSQVVQGNILQQFIGELGFNFTTVLFVISSIGIVGYQYGQTYLGDLITLVPRSIDPTGTVNYFQSLSGANWLQATYGNVFQFGLGFSLIGEAFYNFGFYGVIVLSVFGYLVAMLQSKDPRNCSAWEKYLKLALLLGILTVPRRDMYQFLKQIEYSVFFMALYLYCFSKIKRTNKKG